MRDSVVVNSILERLSHPRVCLSVPYPLPPSFPLYPLPPSFPPYLPTSVLRDNGNSSSPYFPYCPPLSNRSRSAIWATKVLPRIPFFGVTPPTCVVFGGVWGGLVPPRCTGRVSSTSPGLSRRGVGVQSGSETVSACAPKVGG